MTKVKCTKESCGHEWDYTGNSNFYITCPVCYRKVSLEKAKEEAKENGEES